MGVSVLSHTAYWWSFQLPLSPEVLLFWPSFKIDGWINITALIFILRSTSYLILFSQSRPHGLGLWKISLLGSHPCHQLFLVVFWQSIQLLIQRINCCHSWVAFVVFRIPVYKLGSSCIGAFLFCGAIASKVSLFPTVETCTLYPSLGPYVICSGDVPSWLPPPPSSPIPS